jgi:HSP20 family molecular chaperone IbpA
VVIFLILIIKAKQNSKSNNRSSSSYFSQVVSLPKDGDVENIMTEFKEGVLKTRQKPWLNAG